VAAALRGDFGVAPAGLAETRWPGDGGLEKKSHPTPYILDGGTTRRASGALARYLENATIRGSPPWMVFGAMRDKAVDDEMGPILSSRQMEVISHGADSPRSLRRRNWRHCGPRPHATKIGAALELVVAREGPARL